MLKLRAGFLPCVQVTYRRRLETSRELLRPHIGELTEIAT